MQKSQVQGPGFVLRHHGGGLGQEGGRASERHVGLVDLPIYPQPIKPVISQLYPIKWLYPSYIPKDDFLSGFIPFYDILWGYNDITGIEWDM